MRCPAQTINTHKSSKRPQLCFPPPPPATSPNPPHINNLVRLHILHMDIFFFKFLLLDKHVYVHMYFIKKWVIKDTFPPFSFSVNTSRKSLHVHWNSSHSFLFNGYIIFLCMAYLLYLIISIFISIHSISSFLPSQSLLW